MAGQDLEQRTEQETDHSFVTLFGEVDGVEIQVVVPYSVDADGYVDQRRALLASNEHDHALMRDVGSDYVIDRLEHRTRSSLGSGTRLKPNGKKKHARGTKEHFCRPAVVV